jgi:hypothetical protein
MVQFTIVKGFIVLAPESEEAANFSFFGCQVFIKMVISLGLDFKARLTDIQIINLSSCQEESKPNT